MLTKERRAWELTREIRGHDIGTILFVVTCFAVLVGAGMLLEFLEIPMFPLGLVLGLIAIVGTGWFARGFLDLGENLGQWFKGHMLYHPWRVCVERILAALVIMGFPTVLYLLAKVLS